MGAKGAGAEIGMKKEASMSDVLKPAGAGIRKRKAIPKHAIPCEGSEVLAKKKEAYAAASLQRSKDVPGAMDLWLERQAKAKEEAAAGIGKKKKVFKYKMSDGLVEAMMRRPHKGVKDLSQEELATRSAAYRHIHTFRQFIDGKMNDYEKTLIDQYIEKGYAEDEMEVTDDDEE
uniref:Uncharacterized protein n=1 Tax=Leersia perrieri TaxID=77586 RepID=A0A0D9WBM1_9ORYZ